MENDELPAYNITLETFCKVTAEIDTRHGALPPFFPYYACLLTKLLKKHEFYVAAANVYLV